MYYKFFSGFYFGFLNKNLVYSVPILILKREGNTYYKQQKRLGNDYIKENIEKIKRIANIGNNSSYIEQISPHPEKAPRQKGVEIYLPISPYICICLYDKQDNVKPLSIRKINKEIILQANEYIFSHKKNFSFVEKILKKNLELLDKKGKRTVVKASFEELLKSTEIFLNKYMRRLLNKRVYIFSRLICHSL